MESETRDVAGESSSGPSASGPAAVGAPTLPPSRKESLPRGVCRVCCEEVTLASDDATGDAATARPEEEVIMLGCSCRAPAHRGCMEAWTKHKGDRTCELCGKTMRNLPEPPPPARATSPRPPGDDFTVVMRPAGDEVRDRVIVITQSQANGDGVVAIRRYYAGTAAEERDRDQPRDDAERRGCLSDCFYLTVFVALFILLFGGPGIVLGAAYVFWFIWIRDTAG